MGHMINRQSHAFSCNSGNNCTRNRLNCTRMRLMQLAVARAIIPELHSKACDYLYIQQIASYRISGNFQGIYISRISLVQAQFMKYKILKLLHKYKKDMVPSSHS